CGKPLWADRVLIPKPKPSANGAVDKEASAKSRGAGKAARGKRASAAVSAVGSENHSLKSESVNRSTSRPELHSQSDAHASAVSSPAKAPMRPEEALAMFRGAKRGAKTERANAKLSPAKVG